MQPTFMNKHQAHVYPLADCPHCYYDVCYNEDAAGPEHTASSVYSLLHSSFLSLTVGTGGSLLVYHVAPPCGLFKYGP